MYTSEDDIINQTHLTLVLGADGGAADRFYQHVITSEEAYGFVRTLPPQKQVDWMILYWKNQLIKCGLDDSRVGMFCENAAATDILSFIRKTSDFICRASEVNILPRLDVPLPHLE